MCRFGIQSRRLSCLILTEERKKESKTEVKDVNITIKLGSAKENLDWICGCSSSIATHCPLVRPSRVVTINVWCVGTSLRVVPINAWCVGATLKS